MNLLFCMLIAAMPSSIAEEDIATLFPEDVPNIRYLCLDEKVEDKDKDHYLSVVSFVLNSISNKKKITLPKFVDKGKTVIRFDIRDYGIDAKAYDNLKPDPYTKKSDKLKKLMKCENPVMRADWFIIKAMAAPTYYKLMGVSDLKDFRKRHGDDGGARKVKTEQAAVVVLSSLSRNTRYVKRVPTLTGAIWETRDSTSVDYLMELLSDKYDSIQLLAFNSNGLISYFAADNKDKPLEELNPEIAVDHSRLFEPDLVVRMARNCIACHTSGVIPIEDHVRGMIKRDIKLVAPDKDAMDRLNDLFGSKLPIEKDQDVYKEALLKATGMTPKDFTHKFIAVWKSYYGDLNLEQAAKETGVSLDDFKKQCQNSSNPYLVNLAVNGKIHRVQFERILEGK